MGLLSNLKNTIVSSSIFTGARLLGMALYTTYINYMDAPTQEEINLLRSADFGDIDALRYYYTTNPELWNNKSRNVGITLCLNGHLNCLKYWNGKGCEIELLHDAASQTKHIECFKYYIEHSTKITGYDIYNIICFDNLEHLRFLVETCRFPILGMDMHIEYSVAVRNNRHTILDYLHELGFREICGKIVCVPTKECMYVYPTEEEQALMPTLRFLDTVYWDGQRKNGSSINGGICAYEEYPKPSYILSKITTKQ